jgi:hypothetical protein
LINDQVGKNPIEENVLVGEIGAAVAYIRDLGQPVEAFEDFSYELVRRTRPLRSKKYSQMASISKMKSSVS